MLLKNTAFVEAIPAVSTNAPCRRTRVSAPGESPTFGARKSVGGFHEISRRADQTLALGDRLSANPWSIRAKSNCMLAGEAP